MPDEPVPPPEEAPEEQSAGTGAATIAALKHKYRLDEEVNLYAKDVHGNRLGKGPILGDEVFDKFAELDHTKNKRYLDWMLFMAGGSQTAFDNSRTLWGDNDPEKPPQVFFSKFNQEKPDHTVHSDELNAIVTKLKEKGLDLSRLARASEAVEDATAKPALADRYNALIALMRANNLAPGNEARVAVEIIGNKFKAWMKNQINDKTRDRVHATSVYSRLIRGMPEAEAEAKWQEMAARRRREYIFGDQDSLKWETFAYNRHWPGRDNVYERVYDAMRKFLMNMAAVTHYNSRIKAYNNMLKRRAGQEEAKVLKPMLFNVNIGKVNVDAEGNLNYKGAYPTIQSVTEANTQVAELPFRLRVTQDVRYAGPKGQVARGAKLYSDENLDVRVPLTVAAAVEGGHPTWDIADPNQLANVKQGMSRASAWSEYTSGHRSHVEWFNDLAIPIYFTVKTPGIPAPLSKILMIAFGGDLVDLQSPYGATVWRLARSEDDAGANTTFPNTEVNFTTVMKLIKKSLYPANTQGYLALVTSFTKAMKAIKDWGKEFDPGDIVSDYVYYHQKRMQYPRTFSEQLRARAAQAIDALLE